MIRLTLSGWPPLGKQQTRLAAPKPPPPWWLGLQDICDYLKAATQRRFHFSNADGIQIRKFYEGRLFNEMFQKYLTVVRRHQSHRLSQLTYEPAVFQSEVDHFLRSGSCP
jgi:hypothetical protein